MKKQLRTALFFAFTSAAALMGAVTSAWAQAVYCTNCSTEITQLLNLARLIDQLTTQGSILSTGNSQFLNMTTNTTPYSSLSWNNGGGNLQSVNSILTSGNAFSFANAGIAALLGAQNGTYNSYLTSPATSQAFAAKYQQWSSNTNSSVQTTLAAGSAQSGQMTGPERIQIAQLQNQAGGMSGNLQGLQTIAQATILTAQQIQALRQLVLMSTSLHANDIQGRSDQLSSEQAAWRTFLNTSVTIPASGGQRF